MKNFFTTMLVIILSNLSIIATGEITAEMSQSFEKSVRRRITAVEEDAKEYIAAINDLKTLEKLAKDDENVFVRIAAIIRLDNEKLLLDIAKTDYYGPVRIAAINKLVELDSPYVIQAKQGHEQKNQELAEQNRKVVEQWGQQNQPHQNEEHSLQHAEKIIIHEALLEQPKKLNNTTYFCVLFFSILIIIGGVIIWRKKL